MGKIGSESWQRLCRKRHNADIAALNHIIRQKDEQIHELKEELRAYRAANKLMKTKEGIFRRRNKESGAMKNVSDFVLTWEKKKGYT